MKYNVDAVERAQRKLTKMVPSLRDLPYTERLRKLKLETLEYLRRRAGLPEAYGIIGSPVPL